MRLDFTPRGAKNANMWFEGAEKKFEIVSKGAKLRGRDPAFWQKTVELAGAKILSKIENEQTSAFLLSESSLFVWDDRMTMITCGRTSLVKAATFLIEELGPENVDLVTYERKNEYYPHQQETDFHKDVQILQERFKGKSFRFGSPDEHHLFLFHGEKPFLAEDSDNTLEILMYHLDGPARGLFMGGHTIEEIRKITRMEKIFPGFQIDDFLFQPCGYSANAIKGGDYYTIHVTPEENGSYVSFETNVRLGHRIVTAIRSVLELFQPRSFDVVYFHPEKELRAFDIHPFIQRNYVRQTLSCGYEVGFSTYYLKSQEAVLAVPLEANP